MFSFGSREPSATLMLDKSPSDFANTRAWKWRTSAANSARQLPQQPSGGRPLPAQGILPAHVHTDEPQVKGLKTSQKICAGSWEPQTHLHTAVLEAARDYGGICFVPKHTRTK